MTIESSTTGVKRLMDRVRDYASLIETDNFEPTTVEDMQGNAKALCDAAKSEIDNIKAEINSWE